MLLQVDSGFGLVPLEFEFLECHSLPIIMYTNVDTNQPNNMGRPSESLKEGLDLAQIEGKQRGPPACGHPIVTHG
jgi:hypothetical protein